MLYRGSEVMREVGWVIFDEIHYMRDKVRVLILSPFPPVLFTFHQQHFHKKIGNLVKSIPGVMLGKLKKFFSVLVLLR